MIKKKKKNDEKTTQNEEQENPKDDLNTATELKQKYQNDDETKTPTKVVKFKKNIVSPSTILPKEDEITNEILSNTNPKLPHQVKELKNLGHSGGNLRGENVGVYNTTTSEFIKPGGSNQEVIKLERNIFYARVTLAVSTNSMHVPSSIKRFFQILRQADPTIQMLPFLQQDNNQQEIITNEKHIPNDEIKMKKWIAGTRLTQNKKLQFSIRLSNTMAFKNLRNTIFQWCKNNKCFVSFDSVKSEMIFRAGWIAGLHPTFYNRNNVKNNIIKNNPDLQDKIHIYAKTIWRTNPDEKTRTITEAMVVDGAIEKKDEILMALFNMKWAYPYMNAKFIPFKLSSQFNEFHQTKAMKLQNQYLHSIRGKVIVAKNTEQKFQSIQGDQELTLSQWLQSVSTEEKRLFVLAEDMTKQNIRIVYTKDNEIKVSNFIAKMFSIFCGIFGKKMLCLFWERKWNMKNHTNYSNWNKSIQVLVHKILKIQT